MDEVCAGGWWIDGCARRVLASASLICSSAVRSSGQIHIVSTMAAAIDG